MADINLLNPPAPITQWTPGFRTAVTALFRAIDTIDERTKFHLDGLFAEWDPIRMALEVNTTTWRGFAASCTETWLRDEVLKQDLERDIPVISAQLQEVVRRLPEPREIPSHHETHLELWMLAAKSRDNANNQAEIMRLLQESSDLHYIDDVHLLHDEVAEPLRTLSGLQLRLNTEIARVHWLGHRDYVAGLHMNPEENRARWERELQKLLRNVKSEE